ncbi:Prepilin peptidase dependent protein B precursor [Salmonella enterica]|nr:Prepilin peptidase dependent protein B precursor [Salmonella enterica]
MAGGRKITSAKYRLFGALRKKVHVLQRVAKFQECAPKIETKGKKKPTRDDVGYGRIVSA